MADDARISTAIRNHPKTRKLQKRLGKEAVLSLIWLFLYAAESQPDGNLAGMSDEDIELAADWEREGEFVSALVEVRFLDGESGNYRIHDWAEHNPWAATRGIRMEAAKHAATVRWEAVRNALKCDPHAEGIDAAQKGNAHLTSPHLKHTTPKKPSAKSAGDDRHTPICNFIKKCITHATKLDPAPWNARDAKVLSDVLKENPSWPVETFENLIRNRFRSDVPRGDPAYKWLKEISKYATGPLDKFGHLQGNENGNQSRADKLIAELRARQSAEAADGGHEGAVLGYGRN